MNINNIIKEEINKYVARIMNEDFNFESDDKNDKDDNDEKKGSEKRGFDQYQKELEALHDNGELNYRKLASSIYGIPTSTKSKANTSKLNSKASALRKKIKGEEGASGGHFHLNATDASNIAQELTK